MNKNDYAPIAPMGWNSYDYYDTTVNEEQVRANAAYLDSVHSCQWLVSSVDQSGE